MGFIDSGGQPAFDSIRHTVISKFWTALDSVDETRAGTRKFPCNSERHIATMQSDPFCICRATLNARTALSLCFVPHSRTVVNETFDDRADIVVGFTRIRTTYTTLPS